MINKNIYYVSIDIEKNSKDSIMKVTFVITKTNLVVAKLVFLVPFKQIQGHHPATISPLKTTANRTQPKTPPQESPKEQP